MVQLSVSCDLDGNHLSRFVISRGDDLGKAALAQDLENLKAVQKLLALSNQIVAFLVIVFGIRLLVLIEAIIRSSRSEASREEVHDVRQLLSFHLLQLLVNLGENIFAHGELGGLLVLVDGDHHYFGCALDH